MNNGKVRIYELSRELNLDNKDILAVCDRLNIAVKSHSSTITESDAERIRNAAEDYVESHSSPRKPTPVKPKSAATEGGDRSGNRKKQQILQIKHKPRSPDRPSSPAEGTAKPPKPVTPSPQAPVNQPAQSSESVPTLNRPARPGADEPTEVEDREIESEPSGREEVDQSQRQPEAEAPSAPEPEAESQPSQPSDETEDSPPQLLEKPVLKRPKAASQSSPADEERSDRAPVAKKPRPEVKEPSRKKGTETDSDSSVPQLQKPQLVRPKNKSEEPEPQESEDRTDRTTGSDEDTDDLKLKRPKPPRSTKRQKKYHTPEEEEVQEFPEGKAKSPPKNKRRYKPIQDDDEDEQLDSELSSNKESGAPVQVNLSVARPPKPQSEDSKSGKSQPSAPSKQRKPAPSRDDGSKSKSARRERRTQPEKNQRPEKLVLTGSMTVRELASELAVAETEIIKELFSRGIAVNVTQTLDVPTAELVAEELGVEVETRQAESEARKVTEMLDANDLENLQNRPPVVTIMGHVDHGKTTLLDSIRKTKVAQGEAGGITQHIGAYHVDVEHEGEMQQIVFLDTPGHEAFTAMRARGTRVTDIAILVVAADDGVQPQTIEAISHAKAAEVPLVIAINKVDKEGAQPDRIKQELMEHGLVPEEWGGETIMVPVSAINGENLETLLEMILLVAELEELSANPNRLAKGTVVEANLDKTRGPVATLLVQNGTLHVGDVLVAGSAFGKVRAMIDDRGERVEAALPSFAVEILGLQDVPAAGDEFEVFPDEKEARAIADRRNEQQRQSRLQQAMSSRRVTLGSLSAKVQEGELKELNLILKADVQGSVEAILGALRQLPQDEVQVRVLLAAPGEVTETDIDLAAASDAVIIGFSTTLASGARQAADRAGVDIREYNVIYKLLDDIQAAMEGLLEPELVEQSLGQAEVRAVFTIGRGTVAGCYVQSGQLARNCQMRVRRDDRVIHEGTLESLKRVKDDVKEVNAGYECGVGSRDFNDWNEGDIIEAYRMVTKRRTLAGR